MTDLDNEKISNAKKKYAEAEARGDSAGMKSAHDEAEAVRANYGYSGGDDGSKNIALNNGSWIGDLTSPTTGKSTYSPAGTSTNYGSYESDLKKLTEAQKRQQIAQLKQARTKALANLDAQEQTIKPMYENQRNLVSASSQQGARSFAEYLANRGLTNSGAAAQGEINRIGALQNSLGQIGTSEADAYRDIANQRTQVENDYVSGLANANANIEANYFNNLLNYNQQQREMVQQLQLEALGQYSNDYQARINELLAQGYSPSSLEVLQLQALRGQKVNEQYNSSMNNAMNNILAGNINYNTAAMAGMTIEQAQQYYKNYQAQQRATAEAEAEQLAWDRKQQEIKNSQNWATINNNIRNTNSLIASRNNSEKTQTFSTKDVIDMVSNAINDEQVKNTIDTLYNNEQIDTNTLDTLYSLYNFTL